MPRGKRGRLTVVDDKPDRPPVLAAGVVHIARFRPAPPRVVHSRTEQRLHRPAPPAHPRRMTPPDPSSPSFGTALPLDDRPVLRVRDQGELVAAVPAMLGFHPRESLVLMATGGRSGRRLGLTLRVDLPPPGHPDYAEHVEIIVASAVRGLLLDDPAGAIAIVVSEPGPARGDP